MRLTAAGWNGSERLVAEIMETYTFRIEVYTDGLLITGSYALPNYRRVSDALNSRLHRFVTLHDATVAPQQRPQQLQRVPQLLVDWGSALMVATLEEPPPPPGFQAAAHPARDAQPMMFFTTGFALRANFYKRPDHDLIAALDQISDDFVPLSQVQIFPLGGGSAATRDFVCLNRMCIQAMYALNVPPPPPPAEDAATASDAPLAEDATPPEDAAT